MLKTYLRLVQLCFVVFDIFALYLSWMLGVALHLYAKELSSPAQLLPPAFFLLSSVLVVLIYLFELYDPLNCSRKLIHTIHLWLAIAIAGVMVIFTSYWTHALHPGRFVLLSELLFFAFFATGWRWIYSTLPISKHHPTNLVIVGSGQTSTRFCRYVHDDPRFSILKFFDDDSSLANVEIADGVHIETTPEEPISEELLASNPIVVSAFKENPPAALERQLLSLRMGGVQVYDLRSFYQRFWEKVAVFHLSNSWFLFSQGFALATHSSYKRIKRLLDIFTASIMLVLSIPVWVVVPLFIRIESKGPILFRQERVGENGNIFNLLKFRSMKEDAEENGAQWALIDDPRMTRVGRWLRLLRFDEIPQLINVLNGEMSLIGPRPERPCFVQELEKEIPFYDMRHFIKPGITGWAQVNYPYGSTVEDTARKLEYDLYYLKHHSFLLDIRIILRTIRVVMLGRGR